MELIKHRRDIRRFIENILKVLQGVLFRHIESKFLLNLLMDVTMFDVRNIGIHHEGHEIQNEVCTLPEDSECSEAIVLEPRIMDGSRSTHAVNHLLSHFYGRRERLGISAKYITEINYTRCQ